MEGIPYIVGQVNECLHDKKKCFFLLFYIFIYLSFDFDFFFFQNCIIDEILNHYNIDTMKNDGGYNDAENEKNTKRSYQRNLKNRKI